MERIYQPNGVIDTVEQTDEIKTRPVLSQGVDMNRLIGQPHLFGRFYDTREGFLMVPVGVMTLQPDGRLTGYSSATEGKWIPYKQGTVGPDRAFAFITAHNDWLPSSTWQQSLADMPIGFYCDEPESPQKLCLVPHVTISRATRVVYLIASCLKFYRRTVPVLLEQLYEEGIDPGRIRVVVNGCPHKDDQIIDGVAYAFSTHNAWEYSTLYEAPLRWEFEYAMLIHDTVRIFPGFRRKVETFNGYLPWDFLPATPMGRCLLGLYSHDFLRRLNPWLEEIDGIDKQNGVITEVAGELVLRARMALALGDPERNGQAREAEYREAIDEFNTGHPRVRRVFPTLNLHKFIHAGPVSPESL